MSQLTFSLFLVTLHSLHICISGIESTTFTIKNNCDFTVWPAIVAPLDNTTSFVLETGESRNLTAPPSWRGRIWGRTGCTDYGTDTLFYCYPPYPASTLAEFAVASVDGLAYFDVSLVDGYNLPMRIVPNGKNCTIVGCETDINKICPPLLRITSYDGSQVVACKNACAAFQRPEYCCTGDYNTIQSCKTSTYAQLFKGSCPQAYSYAYDSSKTTFSCASTHFEIIFCPSSSNTRQTHSEDSSQGTENSLSPLPINGGTRSKNSSNGSDASHSVNVQVSKFYNLLTMLVSACSLMCIITRL